MHLQCNYGLNDTIQAMYSIHKHNRLLRSHAYIFKYSFVYTACRAEAELVHIHEYLFIIMYYVL